MWAMPPPITTTSVDCGSVSSLWMRVTGGDIGRSSLMAGGSEGTALEGACRACSVAAIGAVEVWQRVAALVRLESHGHRTRAGATRGKTRDMRRDGDPRMPPRRRIARQRPRARDGETVRTEMALCG